MKFVFLCKIMNIRYVISLVFLLLTSCASYNKVHPLISTNSYRSGIWGNWKNTYYTYSTHISYNYIVTTQYNSQYLTIYIHSPYSHPSEYEVKMEIDKSSRINQIEKWYTFNGKISIGKYYYMRSDLPYVITEDCGSTNTCEFLCDEDMIKSILKNGLKGTINVFYNNAEHEKVGMGFVFD